MSRTKRVLLNSGSKLIYEITGVICSIILPRLILVYYGSDVNGLVLSVTRFLSISTFMDAAIGGVCRAALYGPLARKDDDAISKVYVSSNSFYKRIGAFFVAYTLIIAVLLPFINGGEFQFFEVFGLTIAISVSYIAQYLVGATNSVLIYADQKVYLTTNINTLTLILNTIASFILIRAGFSIQAVKLVTSLIYTVRPIYAYFYCKKNYNINKKATYDVDPIKNKWSGFSHQIAETVHNNVDVVMLTVVSVYSDVSIYSVYALVTEGISKLIECIRSGMGPAFGNLLVTETQDKVRKRFANFEWIMNVSVCILYSCCAVLLMPFIRLYTSGITDANYIQPVFGVALVIATLLHNMKFPYTMIVNAAGHFKETQASAFIEMSLNIIVSLIFVWRYGLIGVAVGTIVAMLYRLIYLAYYVSKNIIMYPMKHMVSKLLINLIIFAGSYILFSNVRNMVFGSYFQWLLAAIVVFLILSIITIIVYGIAYKNDLHDTIQYITRLFKPERKEGSDK